MSSPCQIEVVSFCDICPRLDSGSSHKTWIEYFQDVWKSCYCSPIFLKFLIKHFYVSMPDYSFLTLAPEAKDIPLNCSLVWKRLSASPPVAPMMLSPREAMISMSPGCSLLTLINFFGVRKINKHTNRQLLLFIQILIYASNFHLL